MWNRYDLSYLWWFRYREFPSSHLLNCSNYNSIDCWCLWPRRTRWSRWQRWSQRCASTNSSLSTRCTPSSTSSSTSTFSPSTIWAPIISSPSVKPSPTPSFSWERIKLSVSLLDTMKKLLTGLIHTELLLIWRVIALFSSRIAQERNARKFSTNSKKKNLQLVVLLLLRQSCLRRGSMLWSSSVTRWSRTWDSWACLPGSLILKSSCWATIYWQRRESLLLLKNARFWNFWTRRCLD